MSAATPDEEEQVCPSSTVSSDSTVQASNHSKLRWQMRGNSPGLPVSIVWERAEPVSLSKNQDFEEVRLDKESSTLLCCRDRTIVTVLRAGWKEFTKQARPNTADSQSPDY